MCGIYCCVSRTGYTELPSSMIELLKRRGPDSYRVEYHELDGWFVTIASSVLSLRDPFVPQPLRKSTSPPSLLSWNGEAWRFSDEYIQGNDSEAVFTALLRCNSDEQVSIVFSKIRGPYACVYLDGPRRKVYFGRDCLGRRSLVKSSNATGDIILASVSSSLTIDHSGWEEVEADGMYVLEFSSHYDQVDAGIFRKIPLQLDGPGEKLPCAINVPYGSLNTALPSSDSDWISSWNPELQSFERVLYESLRIRCRSLHGNPTQPLAVLFSGGIDCSLLISWDL